MPVEIVVACPPFALDTVPFTGVAFPLPSALLFCNLTLPLIRSADVAFVCLTCVLLVVVAIFAKSLKLKIGEYPMFVTQGEWRACGVGAEPHYGTSWTDRDALYWNMRSI